MAQPVVTPAQVRAAIAERAGDLAARTIREEHVVAAVNTLLLEAYRYPTTLALADIKDALPARLGGRAARLAFSHEQLVDIVHERFRAAHTVHSVLSRDKWEPVATVKITFSEHDDDGIGASTNIDDDNGIGASANIDDAEPAPKRARTGEVKP